MPGDFDLVKERVDIVQLIAERVALRKAGRVFKGLCPFHPEKTPSFQVDPDRRTYHCFGCLPPGSLVKTARGPRPIEAVGVGDAVYAADGQLHAVVQVHEHLFDGELVELTASPFKVPLVLTPDHELPVIRPKSRRLDRIPAGLVRPQNYLVYPAIRRPHRDLDWAPRPEWVRDYGPNPKPLPLGVDTGLFAEWLGWYLAEGSVSNDRSVRFSLSSHEASTANRIAELSGFLFGETPRSQTKGTGLELWFCHALLARWLKFNCGAGAHNKRIPDFVWGWSPTHQRALFTALMAGDGHTNRGGPIPLTLSQHLPRSLEETDPKTRSENIHFAKRSSRLTSASARLIDDARDLLLANGIVPTLTERTEPDGRKAWHVSLVEADQFRWGAGERPPQTAVPVRVRKVGRFPYRGPVHDLTVAEDHTYITMSAVVFNCGKGGDIFTWLEEQDGLEPVEALRVLADRAGVELTSRRDPAAQEREKRLLAANDTALFYFRQALRGTERGREVAGYLEGRGIRSDTVERFGLGYAPDLRDGLLSYLVRKGYREEEAVAAGLASKTERGLWDRFRDRLMVPIKDGRGRIIAFGGRAMRPDQRGKYVNSPQTDLFNKSGTLYALDAARAAIRKERAAIIVEGYFDAIAMHQAGFGNVVASMGTALTEEQYHVLDAMRSERAHVACDGDAAGQRSAEQRGSELARQVQRAVQRAGRGSVTAKTGLAVYVTVLPNETDPDELARRDPERLRALVGEAKPILEFVIERIASRSGLEGPEGRRRFLAEALPLVADEPDPLTRELYLGTLSRLTGLTQESLRREAEAAPARPNETRASGDRSAPSCTETGAKQTASLERYLMALLTRFPDEAARVDLGPGDFSDPDFGALFSRLSSGEHSTSDLPAHLAAIAAALGASAPEHADEFDAGQAIELAALKLREQNRRRHRRDTREKLARAGEGDVSTPDGEVEDLASQLNELMRRRERHTVLHAADVEQRDE